MKATTLKKAKKKAWDVFSVYIRKPKNGDENQQCYTCGAIKKWQEMDAGHGISGRNNAVLFLEAVVKPQCQQCNRFKHGELHIFTRKLIEELGLEQYDELLRGSNLVVKYSVQDYLQIEQKYKELFSDLVT